MDKNQARQVNDEEFDEAQRSIKLAHFDQYRGLLFSIAYRMLGSVADAEDVLQETFLKWQDTTQEDILM